MCSQSNFLFIVSDQMTAALTCVDGHIPKMLSSAMECDYI